MHMPPFLLTAMLTLKRLRDCDSKRHPVVVFAPTEGSCVCYIWQGPQTGEPAAHLEWAFETDGLWISKGACLLQLPCK